MEGYSFGVGGLLFIFTVLKQLRPSEEPLLGLGFGIQQEKEIFEGACNYCKYGDVCILLVFRLSHGQFLQGSVNFVAVIGK